MQRPRLPAKTAPMHSRRSEKDRTVILSALWRFFELRTNAQAHENGPRFASDGCVPLHPVLANHLQQWRCQTSYRKDTDFVFASFKARGSIPLSSSIFVSDHLRPAAKKAGVQIQDGHRFGLHNLRHLLSNWLVNKGKIEPKTVQGILRHSRIQTALDLYTQEDSDEARGAQGEFLKAVGVHSGMTQ